MPRAPPVIATTLPVSVRGCLAMGSPSGGRWVPGAWTGCTASLAGIAARRKRRPPTAPNTIGADGDRPSRLPRRRRDARGGRRRPRDRRGAAARRRRLRGAAALRRPAVRARRAPGAARALGREPASARSTSPPCVPTSSACSTRPPASRTTGCCAIVITRGGRRLLLIEPLPAHAPAIRLATVTYAPVAPARRGQVALLRREHARDAPRERAGRRRGAARDAARARAGGADVVDLLGQRRRACCTPPLSDHILASITRARVLELAGAEERSCTLEELLAADEAFLASTTREVQPVASVDGERSAARDAGAESLASSSQHLPRADPARRWSRPAACASSPSSGTARSSSRPRPSRRACARAARRSSSTPVSTTTTSCRRSSSTSSSCRRPSTMLGIGGGTNTAQTARMLARARAAAGRRRARRGARLRRHELDARGRARGGAGAGSRSRTSRRACARSTARCRRRSTASSPTTSRALLLCPSQTAVDNLARESVGGRGRARRRRDGRRRAAAAAGRARRARMPLRAPTASSRAATCSRPRTAPATSTIPRAWRLLVELLRGAAARRSCCRCTRARAPAWRLPACSTRLASAAHIRLAPPLGYLDFTALLCNAARGR